LGIERGLPGGRRNYFDICYIRQFYIIQDEIYGDLNGDGKVNSSDLAILKRYMLRAISDFPIPEGRKLADLNRDGNVNSTDYSILKRYILKAIDNIPVDD